MGIYRPFQKGVKARRGKVDIPPILPYLKASATVSTNAGAMDIEPRSFPDRWSRILSQTEMYLTCLARVLPVAALLGACLTARGQVRPSELLFHRISTDEGLSQSVVLCVIQDNRGFMWFGTEDGLNRYDGHNFVTYRHDPIDSNSLSSSYIWALHEDRDGLIWIGTWGGGLTCHDPVHHTFTRYQTDPSDSTSISHDRVTAISEDSLGFLWICTAGGGLNRLDRASRTFTRMPNVFASLPTAPRDDLFCMLIDRSGIIWIGSYFTGLLTYDPRSGSVSEFRHNLRDATSISDDRILSLCEDDNGDLWVGTWGGGLNRLNCSHRKFEHFRTSPDDTRSIPGDIIRSLYQDRKGRLWIGTVGDGAALFDRQSRSFTRFSYSPFPKTSLSDDVVTALFEDAAEVMWFGTANGLCVSSPYIQKFGLYTPDGGKPHSLSGRRVFAMCMDSAGFVWIGTEDGGLNRFDPRTGTFLHYRHDPSNPASLPHDYVSALMTDAQGSVWVGTYGGGLARLDRRTERFHRYRMDPDNPSRRLNAYISAIEQDRNGNIWVGTWIVGLAMINPSGSILKVFTHDSKDPSSLPDDDIRSLAVDQSGTLWVGTARGGIGRYDAATESFTSFRKHPANPRSLSSNYVQAILPSTSGTFWVGTFGGGLNKLDPVSGECVHFTVHQGLPNNVVYAVLEDAEGKLWLSTNQGISCFDPVKSTFENFTKHDGLQADEFNYNAACLGPDGTLFFGGVNGFNSVRPGDIRTNPHVPPIVITGFRVFDRPLQHHLAPFATDALTLSYEDNFFSFEYAALDFSLPDRNTYAYILEGIDKTWVMAGTRRMASYTNIEPGQYVFRIRGANNDGIWNNSGVSMRITISPPFWKTLWFRIGIGLFCIAGITIAYRLRVASLLRVERMRLNIAADLHDEIGSNLASIAVLADLVRRRLADTATVADQLQDISRAARTTSDSLRDIVWFVNPEHDTTDNMRDRMQGIAAKLLAGMEYTFQVDDRAVSKRLPMTFRRDLVLLYKEALSNVVRHAGATRVSIQLGERQGHLSLQVSDNGRGFDPQLPTAGNGLTTMRRRAERLGAPLIVTSSPEKGTIVSLEVKLP